MFSHGTKKVKGTVKRFIQIKNPVGSPVVCFGKRLAYIIFDHMATQGYIQKTISTKNQLDMIDNNQVVL